MAKLTSEGLRFHYYDNGQRDSRLDNEDRRILRTLCELYIDLGSDCVIPDVAVQKDDKESGFYTIPIVRRHGQQRPHDMLRALKEAFLRVTGRDDYAEKISYDSQQREIRLSRGFARSIDAEEMQSVLQDINFKGMVNDVSMAPDHDYTEAELAEINNAIRGIAEIAPKANDGLTSLLTDAQASPTEKRIIPSFIDKPRRAKDISNITGVSIGYHRGEKYFFIDTEDAGGAERVAESLNLACKREIILAVIKGEKCHVDAEDPTRVVIPEEIVFNQVSSFFSSDSFINALLDLDFREEAGRHITLQEPQEERTAFPENWNVGDITDGYEGRER